MRDLAGELGDGKTRHPERVRVVLAELGGDAREPYALLRTRIVGLQPSEDRLDLIAPGRQPIRAAERRIELDRLIEKPERFLVLRKAVAARRQRAQEEIVGGEIARRLVTRAFGLLRAQ